MSPGETAQIITAVAAVGAMLTSAVGLLVSYLNRGKIEAVKTHVEKVETKVVEVAVATNGLTSRNEAIAKKLGVAEGTAAGLQQGRDEAGTK